MYPPENEGQPFDVTSVSVIIPVYKTGHFALELAGRISSVLGNFRELRDFEIVFVDDGSSDDSWEKLRDVVQRVRSTRAIRLSRNYGQWTAIAAGIQEAKNDTVVVMDGDLEDLPEQIPLLLSNLSTHELVFALSERRNPTLASRGSLSRAFFWIWRKLNENRDRIVRSSFLAMRPVATNAFRRYPETQRTISDSIFQHIGLRSSTIHVPGGERPGGGSSYTITDRLRLARRSLFNSTTRLLHAGAILGVVVSACGLLGVGVVTLLKILGKSFETGWVSLLLAVVVIGGLNLLYMGVVGLHLETIFHEVKRRPLYLIQEVI